VALPPAGSPTCKFGSHEGTAALTVQIPLSGRYRVRSTSSAAPSGSHFAFGSSIAGRLVATVVPAAVLTLAGIVGGHRGRDHPPHAG